MSKVVGNKYIYSGCVHMHTTESDGTKTLEEVIAIGQTADLDFMMFTDHMNLNNRDRGGEGWYDKTLILIGYEHNDPKDAHHYLIFNSPVVYPSHMSAKEYVAAGAADGAFGILAHPDEVRSRMPKYPPYPWLDWTVDGFSGIELWNQMSEWMETLTPYNKLPMVFSPRKSMIAPTDRILRTWDELNMKRPVVGIASVDAHAFPVKIGPFTIELFPYKVHFRCIRTHLVLDQPLSENFATARDEFYKAMRECRVFLSNYRWGDASDFQFVALCGDQKVSCGGYLPSPNKCSLRVSVPHHADLRLIRNGKEILRRMGNSLEHHVTAPGVYRVEAWRGRRAWILSNHIRIGM